MDDAVLGKKLRKLRMQAGKTVPEVSEHLKSVGCKAATQTIYGWERGHSQPTIDTFMEMCIFYGVTDIFSHFGENPIETKISPSTDESAPGEKQLISLYRELNEEGQEKLVDYADDLVVSGKYIKSDKDKLGTEKHA